MENQVNSIREDAKIIIRESIQAVMPEAAVLKALHTRTFNEDVVLVAIGKAAWRMAKAASEALGSRIKKGIVVTKYDHAEGPIENCEILEAGHPVPDNNSVFATMKVLEMTSGLTSKDQVIFLISGGGSALFEKPMEGVSLEDIVDLTNQLLGCGANITEINTIRKHLSAVKGGRFAMQCGGAKILAIVLSDVVGDRLDSIASGPAYPDSTTTRDAFNILKKYNIQLKDHLYKAFDTETPKTVDNCETVVTGSVTALCEAAAQSAQKLGYAPMVLSTSVEGDVKEMSSFFASLIKELSKEKNSENMPNPPCALIAGGETVVRVTGNGKGGRNQELSLMTATGIEGIENVVFFSLGSDGTDGPTDAAGGIVDGGTAQRIRSAGRTSESYLENNDSYHALEISGDLIVTGPTGTNVNDLMVVLCR